MFDKHCCWRSLVNCKIYSYFVLAIFEFEKCSSCRSSLLVRFLLRVEITRYDTGLVLMLYESEGLKFSFFSFLRRHPCNWFVFEDRVYLIARYIVISYTNIECSVFEFSVFVSTNGECIWILISFIQPRRFFQFFHHLSVYLRELEATCILIECFPRKMYRTRTITSKY